MISQCELEFRATGTGASQNERLRDYLQRHPGRWIPMPELAQVITPTGIGAAVHSRIADCRKKYGMIIHQQSHRSADGQNHSSYFFEPAP